MNNIKIIYGNITKLQVDAIVNAANNLLLGGGGDGAIHRQAGLELLEECRTLGECVTGAAKITKGYRLTAKYVIHAVGPVWKGSKANEANLLANCYWNSLELAVENEIRSIALLSISTGIYGYPVEKAAKVAIQEVVNFITTHLEESLEIIFVMFGGKTKRCYQETLNEIIKK